MGPNGSENFKTLLLQITAKSFQTFQTFTKLRWGFLKFWVSRFLTIFFRKFQIHQCSLWGNQKPQLSGKRATVERNEVKFGPRGWVFSVRRVLLTLKRLKSFWGHWVHFDFRKTCILKTAVRRAKRSEIWAVGWVFGNQNQTYPVYAEYSPLRPKFHTVSLYNFKSSTFF